MSKVTQKQQGAAFVAACEAGDLLAQVRIAKKKALFLIMEDGIDQDKVDVIDALVGEPFVRGGADTQTWKSYCYHIDAALALGIAIGQLVHRDVFSTGGARSGAR
jgi:hypothetical protein